MDKKLGTKTHLWARLETLLGDRDHFKERLPLFRQEISENADQLKKFGTKIGEIRMKESSLLELLNGKKEAPYAACIRVDSYGEDYQQMAEDVGFIQPGEEDTELFYEYWYWFFRHARKQAVENRRKEADK